MSAVISRESRTSDAEVSQDMFTVSDGIIISSDMPSDSGKHLKEGRVPRVKNGRLITKQINNVHFVHKHKVPRIVVGAKPDSVCYVVS